jgi:predicted NACHT family NTPase
MPDEITGIPIENLINDIYSGLAGPIKKKYKIYHAGLKIAELHDYIKNVEKVKTIWQPEKEVKILDFYYPSKITDGKKKYIAESLNDLSSYKNLVIQGIAGQGKSIFLRYLCIQELVRGEYIPIFIELRHIDENQSFKELLFSSLNIMGLNFDDTLFQHFAESGKIALFLDGFDEIPARYVRKTIKDIEFYCQKFNKLPVIITSRPNADIKYSPHFRVLKISNLNKEDRRKMIHKLVDGDPYNLISSIEKKPHFSETLITPLLVTLLVITYKSFNEIPDQHSEFYDSLFQTLLKRHDGSKAGFVSQVS